MQIKIEVIEKILEVILAPITYFAGIQRGKIKSEEDAINMVVNNYFITKNSGHYAVEEYPDILIKAGIAVLGKVKNKRKTINEIVMRGENDILHLLDLNDIDLENFFRGQCHKDNRSRLLEKRKGGI